MRQIRINIAVVMVAMIATGLIVSCGLSQQSGPEAAAKAKHPEADFSRSCVECHTEATPEITAKWASSGHGKLNYGCYICHGDGVQTFTVKPHSNGCISCHSGSMEHLEDVGDVSCFECHNGHTLIAD